MHDRLVTSAHAKYALMGDGTGSAPPGPDRTVTPALPPGGGHLFSRVKQASASRNCTCNRLRFLSYPAAVTLPSRHSSNRTAPSLDSGSFPLPHLGDWVQEGHPAAHPRDAISWAVAARQS